MKISMILCGGAVIVLSGCGASGGDVSLDDLQSRIATIGSTDFTTPTPFDDLPSTGRASYTGVASIEVVGDTGNEFLAIGSAVMVAEFDTQQISGTADNFFQADDPDVVSYADATGARIDGNLTFELEQEIAGINYYVGGVNGKLSPSRGADVDVDAPVDGIFSGQSGEAFYGAGSAGNVIFQTLLEAD